MRIALSLLFLGLFSVTAYGGTKEFCEGRWPKDLEMRKQCQKIQRQSHKKINEQAKTFGLLNAKGQIYVEKGSKGAGGFFYNCMLKWQKPEFGTYDYQRVLNCLIKEMAAQEQEQLAEKRRKAKPKPHYSKPVEVNWEQAEGIVKNLPCSKGGTVDQYLTKKAEIPAVEDMGWITKTLKNGFSVERLLLLNQTMSLWYRWHVDTTGKAKPVNGKAIDITKEK